MIPSSKYEPMNLIPSQNSNGESQNWQFGLKIKQNSMGYWATHGSRLVHAEVISSLVLFKNMMVLLL